MNANPLRNMPRRAVVVFLLAVFFTFVAVGLAGDVVDMGRQISTAVRVCARN